MPLTRTTTNAADPTAAARGRVTGTDTLAYRSIDDLRRDTELLARSLPANVDLVVGDTRNGKAASSLARRLDATLVDVRDLQATDEPHREEGPPVELANVGRAVRVVDAVGGRRTLADLRAELAEIDLPFEVSLAAVYVDEAQRDEVDYWGAVVERPRIFEWNLLHHPLLERSCVDIDGVLCRDPTPEENDDGERYEELLRSVKPLEVPTERIGWLVTSRLEAYREETEAWLDRHDVRYDELVMTDHANAAERRAAGDHGTYKAEVYRSVNAALFVESDPRQATTIAERSRKPAFSFRTGELLEPGDVACSLPRSGAYLSRFRRHPVPFVHTTARNALHVVTRTLRRLPTG